MSLSYSHTVIINFIMILEDIFAVQKNPVLKKSLTQWLLDFLEFQVFVGFWTSTR